MRMTTVSSRRITTQAPISGDPSEARTTSGPNGRRRPRASPPPTAAEPTRNVRRSIFGMVMASSSCLGRNMDRLAHLLEGAATADVGDRRVDVGIRGLRLLAKERRDRHDHPRLAVATLRHVVLEPRLLHLGQGAAGGEAVGRWGLFGGHC